MKILIVFKNGKIGQEQRIVQRIAGNKGFDAMLLPAALPHERGVRPRQDTPFSVS